MANVTIVQGDLKPELGVFDVAIQQLMAHYALPGGQLAVAKDGRLVLSRAYGKADVERGEPVTTDALFRIASVSKTITAVAILALVEDDRLALTDHIVGLLESLHPPANAPADSRLGAITIKNLLQHAGGWDSARSGDPQFPPATWQTAGILGVSAPPAAQDIVRAKLAEPLDFDPGSRTAYSNFGYNVLGRVIEQVARSPYDAYVQTRLLRPAGISAMQLGRTRLAERAPREVRYYAPPDQPWRPSVFPGEGYAAFAYGGYYQEALDAHGGWLASAEDLVRFATAVDGQRGSALLKPETVRTMLTEPLPATEEAGSAGAGNERAASGLGWVVRHMEGGGVEWSHAGALEGTCASWLFRGQDGVTIAFVFNSLPQDYAAFFPHAIEAITQAAAAVSTWPAHDLFAPAETPGG